MSNLIVFSGGNNINNSLNNFGGCGDSTTSRVYNSVHTGRIQPQLATGRPRPGNNNTNPLQWLIAVITDTHPGKDNSVRVMTLKNPKGILKRPITKTSSLPRVINN
jgi:hypothetical protein